MTRFINVADEVLSAVKKDDFAGYDPFDSLNSRYFKSSPLYRSEFLRLAWLQFGKRSPINFRPVFGVDKKRNPKGVALFILGMLEDYQRCGERHYLSESCRLGDWLLEQVCTGEYTDHACWGYHFDWQARAFYVPVGKPNIITTCYVARALDALTEICGDNRYRRVAFDSACFIAKKLKVEDSQGSFFAYIPGEKAFVHNASLWGAAWVGRVGAAENDEQMKRLALAVADRSVKGQQSDGSWVYGARSHHQFIDGFHTGYNLEALHLLQQSLDIDRYDDSIVRGLDYYRNQFFLADGTAKYYNDCTYPLDMHSFAQSVFTLLRLENSEEHRLLVEKILSRAVDTMYLPEKHQFIYQKTARLNNCINYTRWTQAWAYFALAFYNRIVKESLS